MTKLRKWLAVDEDDVYLVEPAVSGSVRAALMLIVGIGMAIETARLMPEGFQDGVPGNLHAGVMTEILMMFWSRLAPWGRHRWGPYEPGWAKAGYFLEALALWMASAALIWGLWAHWSYGWAPAAAPLATGLVAALTLAPFGLVIYMGRILWRRRQRTTPS